MTLVDHRHHSWHGPAINLTLDQRRFTGQIVSGGRSEQVREWLNRSDFRIFISDVILAKVIQIISESVGKIGTPV